MSFHWKSIWYRTCVHITKKSDESWFITNHEDLLQKCQLFPIETYIERRQRTLQVNLEKLPMVLMNNTERSKGYCKDKHKIYW